MDKEFSLYQLLNVERTATGEQIVSHFVSRRLEKVLPIVGTSMAP